MSYYDWVNTIESLKTLPRDEEIIKNLKNKEIEDNKYVLARLIVHIYETIDERLHNAGLICLKEIISGKGDINTVELNLINLKKEKQYVLELINLKIFDKEIKEKIKQRIYMKFQEITEFLKDKTKNIDKDGIYISIFEKIISSNMEE